MIEQGSDRHEAVRVFGEPIAYRDGSEERMLEIIEAAADRSSDSDELAEQITDWPSRYHLSPLRANLVRPLDIRAGMRVLDVGAGMGTMTRALAERDAAVTAVEGTLERARVAAARCEGFPNVTILCGPVTEFQTDEPFDVVLCIGVLEYAAAAQAEAGTHEDFLHHLRSLVASDGHLVLAIENQLGLKYLLGYPEDHLGHPWEGIEGYQGNHGIRTFSRRLLSSLLDRTGFPEQTWLYPFPDYKLPTAVLSASAFRTSDADRFVDQLIREPIRDQHRGRTLLCDDRGAHRVLLDAGLGEEVANSFLVIAGAQDAVDGLVDPDVLAWHFGSDRLRLWTRARRIEARGEDRTVRLIDRAHADEPARGWLRQHVPEEQRFAHGPTLEQLVLQAAADLDTARIGELLRSWSARLESESEPAKDPEPVNPFVAPETTVLLPGRYLDSNLDNFILEDGQPQFFDAEWEAVGGVDLELVRARALWYQARRLVLSGHLTPWELHTTVGELLTVLANACDRPVNEDLRERLIAAESELQAIVTGRPLEVIRAGLRDVMATSRADEPALQHLPFTRLRGENRRLTRRLEGTRDRLRTIRDERDAAREASARAEERLAGLQAAVDSILRSRRWRLGNAIGNVADRVTGRRGRAVSEEQRIRALLE